MKLLGKAFWGLTLSSCDSECSCKPLGTSCSPPSHRRGCTTWAGTRRKSPCQHPGHSACQPTGLFGCSLRFLKNFTETKKTLLTSCLASICCLGCTRSHTYPTGPFRCSSGSTGLEQLAWPPTQRWSRQSGGSKSQTPPAGSLHPPCTFRWCNQPEPPFSGSPAVPIKDKRQKMRDETCLR